LASVTDNDWFAFLSQQLGIDEVNFWLQSRKEVEKRDLKTGSTYL